MNTIKTTTKNINIHMSQHIMGVVLTKSWKIFISDKWGWNSIPPTGYLKAKKSL